MTPARIARRTQIQAFILRHRWLPFAAALTAWCVLIVALMINTGLYVRLGAGLAAMMERILDIPGLLGHASHIVRARVIGFFVFAFSIL